MDKEETHSPNTDLSLKYNKLATEYAKIRSQVNVLKRAVVDEQSKTSGLKDELNERDKTIRKNDQEIDSLNFRNQQLEKRVGVLQGDLTEKGKKSSKKSDSKKNESHFPEFVSKDSVPLTELLTKIDENVQLTRKISQQEDVFKKQISDLTNSYEDKLKSGTSRYRELQQEFDSQKTSLTRSVNEASDQLQAAKDKIGDLERKLKHYLGGCSNSSEVEEESKQNAASPAKPCDLINKLVKSQQETEYWKLEYELNKMKHNKTILKYEECRKHLKSLGRDDLLLEVNEVTTPDSSVVTTLIGKMEITECGEFAERGPSYEKELIEYFTRRVNELIHLLQLCDSKATTFYDECKALEMHLILAVEDRNRIQDVHKELQSKHNSLSEELQLITNTYESQLQTLTEHIANMNDKLASQTETIEHLEFQLKHGSKKK